MQVAGQLIAKQHVGMFGLERAADQDMRRLAGADARRGCLDGGDAGTFLAHEGARRAGHLVDDRDVAGEQVGKLRQKQRRPQFGGQFLVEQHVAVVAAFGRGENVGVDRLVALAAAGSHHHVHGRAEIVIALDAGVVQRHAGGVGAEPLPGFHLPLVAALGDLQVPVDLRQRVDGVGREARGFEHRLQAGLDELAPMRIRTFSQRRDKADA